MATLKRMEEKRLKTRKVRRIKSEQELNLIESICHIGKTKFTYVDPKELSTL